MSTDAKVMFEGNVRVHLLVLPDPVEELLMTSSSEVVGDISLEEWLDMVIASGKGGIKLNFKVAFIFLFLFACVFFL